MKSKISNIYFLILGLLIFGTFSVSAAFLLQSNEVSFTSDKTSENTIKGALDELYELIRIDCPVGYVCTSCAAGTYANQENTECLSCPVGYTSDVGSGKISDCYIETTAGKYIANANETTQVQCPAGSYCPSKKVIYGSTGNNVTCPRGYTSAAGAASVDDCVPKPTYTYTKVGENGFTGTYTCEVGFARLTGCSYDGVHGKAVCNGGSSHLSAIRLCATPSNYHYNLYNYCRTSISGSTYGGGLPETEICD